MSDIVVDFGETEPHDPEVAREAWLLATGRMSRMTRIIFQLRARGRSYTRIAVMLRIPKWRVRRHMAKAIALLVPAFRDPEERRR